MSIFKGAGVAVITPFNEDESVNYDELGRILDDQIEKGTDAIIICGTTGEAATLSHEEHLDVIRYAIKHVNKRIPVIAGTGSNSTETAVYLSQEAEKAGADALLVVTPYYNKATQKGLIEHYKIVADSVSLPIIVYNVPSRTGCNVLPATLAKMVETIPNIVAVKEASGNITQVAELAALCGDKLDIYSGNDDQIVPIMSMGGIGCISVLSNILPAETREICTRFFNGDIKGAAALQCRYKALIDALFSEVNPIPAKAALAAMGVIEDCVRLPLTRMEDDHREKLLKLMRAEGLKV